jgi:hypothetical protein
MRGRAEPGGAGERAVRELIAHAQEQRSPQVSRA